MAFEPAPSDLLYFRPPTIDDLDRIDELEAAGYPPDEAASHERLAFRIEHAAGLFLVAVQAAAGPLGGDELVGFVCGTATCADHLTQESMGRHEPEGALLCIHSVCVATGARRRRVATRLLHAYLAYVRQTSPQLAEARLLCKEALVPLYAGVGFVMVGLSSVEHGQDAWLEMRLPLGGGGAVDGSDGEVEGAQAWCSEECSEEQEQPVERQRQDGGTAS